MSNGSMNILMNFLRTQQPTEAYEIPNEDSQGNDIDVYDTAQMARFDPDRDFKSVPLDDVDLSLVTEVDEQLDAGGLIVITRDGNYLIPYN